MKPLQKGSAILHCFFPALCPCSFYILQQQQQQQKYESLLTEPHKHHLIHSISFRLSSSIH